MSRKLADVIWKEYWSQRAKQVLIFLSWALPLTIAFGWFLTTL